MGTGHTPVDVIREQRGHRDELGGAGAGDGHEQHEDDEDGAALAEQVGGGGGRDEASAGLGGGQRQVQGTAEQQQDLGASRHQQRLQLHRPLCHRDRIPCTLASLLQSGMQVHSKLRYTPHSQGAFSFTQLRDEGAHALGSHRQVDIATVTTVVPQHTLDSISRFHSFQCHMAARQASSHREARPRVVARVKGMQNQRMPPRR